MNWTENTAIGNQNCLILCMNQGNLTMQFAQRVCADICMKQYQRSSWNAEVQS